MAIVKSKLLNQLKKSYPNFLKKDLEKVVSVVLNEIKQALKREDRVELRGFGMFSTKIQKARISRNPKTGEEVPITARQVVTFRASNVLKSEVSDLSKVDTLIETENR